MAIDGDSGTSRGHGTVMRRPGSRWHGAVERPSTFRPDISPVGTDGARVMRCRRSLVLAAGCCCCCHRSCQAPVRTPCPAVPGVRLVTARTVQGMAPYPGQARCLALGFWPECFRRLDVKGGRRSFPKETRSALDIEGKHVTIQGPSSALTSSVASGLSGGRSVGFGSAAPGAVVDLGGSVCGEVGADPRPHSRLSTTRIVMPIVLMIVTATFASGWG